MSCFPQWLKSLVCPRLTRPRPPPSSHLRPPAPSTSCLCCCAFGNAAVTCLSSRRWRPNCPSKSWGLGWEAVFGTQDADWLCSSRVSAQTLDSSELQGDGIVLSLEEQLSAMSLTSSPSPSGSGPDPKATVSLNGTRFPSQLFEDTSLSTKVSGGVVHCPLSRLPCAKDEPCRWEDAE